MLRDMKLHRTSAAIIFFFLLLFSCNKMDDVPGDDILGKSPLLLSAEAPSPFTRAYVPQGMYDNFKVYAASEKDGARTTVMDGYEVKFVTDDWSYVTDTQSLMYWNSNADSYLFTAGAPIDAVTAISTTSMTLHIENNKKGSAMACEPLKIARSSAEFGKTVNLQFSYAHCMVCVAFKKNATENVQVSDITIKPNAAITSKANLTYSFDWTTSKPSATTQLSDRETSSESLSFDNVTIPAATDDAQLSATRYYCVPDASNQKQWTVSLKCDGEEKTGQFENSYTWESGKNYIYVFSLEGKSPKLVKVIRQDDFFDCNDIVPGGEFSGSDMTE
ncbi:MAG: fimbrillin family protein [Prevotella sp.]